MFAAEQSEFEIYRVIVARRNAAEFLLATAGDHVVLPTVRIPRWQRVVENLTNAFTSEWGQRVICLFTCNDAFPEVNGDKTHYQVAEHWQHVGEPHSPTVWMPVSALSPESFADRCDYREIQQASVTCRSAQLGPFVRPGWFKDLYQWVEAAADREGFHLTGEFRQLNASPAFSLIRFQTDGPAFWFKAVGEPNQREFSITRTLAELFPQYVPPIVADRPDWNGWLTREAEGASLDETQECGLWEAAGAALAELQVESLGQGDPILACGAHDLRVKSLADVVQPFMETVALLMDQQTKVPPPILSRAELAVLEKHVREALDTLNDLEIPDTLGHLDLNPGNIVVGPERCAFLDWPEAYVGHPFFTFQYLLEHGRRTLGMSSAMEAKLVESYCAPWKQVVSHDVIAAALDLAPLLAVFTYACGSNVWRETERLKEPTTAGYLRSLTRRMNREVKQTEERRSMCVP